jgi:mannose-6-phosphate isomerase-like protein (cupin superfamily)
VIDKDTAEAYIWGAGCDGWWLVDRAELSVIHERMPPGTAEVWHHHQVAWQFFFVLSGTATMEFGGQLHTLHAQQGIEVAPGLPHQMRNDSNTPKPVQSLRIPLWVCGGWPRHAPFRRAARWDGVSFKSIHHETREFLTLDEFQAGVAYVQAHRSQSRPFEIVMSGDTSGDRHDALAKVQAFQMLGATWWVEEGLGWSLEEFREHIQSGPPRP